MQRIHWQMLTQKIFSIVKNNQFQNLQKVKWQNTQLLVKRSANPFHKCIFVKRKIKNIRIFCLRAWKEEGLSNLFLNIFEIFFWAPILVCCKLLISWEKSDVLSCDAVPHCRGYFCYINLTHFSTIH